ncbi:Multifunctional pyrimidine synthesis protein CAD [Tulasnella sp. 331]|nr:Multifunctional pyrimidine synthesis protein CAD [Tulasnella sp. 331]
MSSESAGNVYFDILITSDKTQETRGGRIVFKLYDKNGESPKTAKNFRELSTGQHGFGYSNTTFHRIIPGFMVQGGDFTDGTGTGGRSTFEDPKSNGGMFDDENLTLKHDRAGILSMATNGPNTNRSQFFITVAPTPWLNGRHVVFGEVIEGMDVVKMIESYGSESGRPKADVRVTACGTV